MTTVTVFQCPDGAIVGFRAAGHTGHAGRGKDIVCSAVSALTQTAVNALESVAGVPTEPLVDEEAGLLEVLLPGKLAGKQAADCQIILRTILQGLTDIEQGYPNQVRVAYKEWRKDDASNEFATVRPQKGRR